MAELKALPTAVLIHIAKLLNVPLKGMDAVIELLDGGATVPFIARYRKEVTGNLDEVQIREIQEKLAAGEKADLILLPAPLIAATEKTVPLRSEGQNCPGPRWHRSHHAAGYNAAGYLDGRSRAQDVT